MRLFGQVFHDVFHQAEPIYDQQISKGLRRSAPLVWALLVRGLVLGLIRKNTSPSSPLFGGRQLWVPRPSDGAKGQSHGLAEERRACGSSETHATGHSE